jgi:hypothetical protein
MGLRSGEASAARRHSCAAMRKTFFYEFTLSFRHAFEAEMKFGPAEMAQMMDGAKALITVMIVSCVGIGIVLGVIAALFGGPPLPPRRRGRITLVPILRSSNLSDAHTVERHSLFDARRPDCVAGHIGLEPANLTPT